MSRDGRFLTRMIADRGDKVRSVPLGANAFEGISDDDSFEARLEAARMNIDDEQYQEAINILTEKNRKHNL